MIKGKQNLKENIGVENDKVMENYITLMEIFMREYFLMIKLKGKVL